MVYIQYTAEEQTIRIPKRSGFEGPCTEIRLEGVNGVWNTLLDGPQETKDYYVVSFALPVSFRKGEYKYSLLSEGGVVASGLAVVGDYTAGWSTRADNKITYVTYGE